MKHQILTLFLLTGTLAAAAQPESLDALFINSETWAAKPEAFMQKAQPLGFAWGSNAKDSARSVAKGMTFLDEPVLETVVRFNSSSVANAMLSLYNRGDAGDTELSVFQKKVDKICSNLTAMANSKGKPVSSAGPVKVDIKTITLSWTKDDISYIMESSWTRTRQPPQNRIIERPEYITITIVKAGIQAVNKIAGEQKVGINLMELKKKIKKAENGDVYLENVPMVDQGQKGYCADATTERVMRYYGMEVNQHELAQKALTATGGGTSPEALLKALKAMAGMLNVRISVIKDMGINDFQSMIQNYNRFAKKADKPEINLPRSGVIDIAQIYRSMDKETYIKMRTANPTAIEQFSKPVQDKINSGLPVVWSVMIGLVDENPALPQAFGGHMRLIIGYNDKTSEIIYSDSWGPGHELKHMKLSDAFAITTGVFTIEPLR